MSPTKQAQAKQDEADENILMIVGSLRAASDAASEGIRGLGNEIKANSTIIASVQITLAVLQKTVIELDSIVRGGTDNLMTGLQQITHIQTTQATAINNLIAQVKCHEDYNQTIKTSQSTWVTGRNITLGALLFVGWIITTMISLAALLYSIMGK
jgi:hypothetical protein